MGGTGGSTGATGGTSTMTGGASTTGGAGGTTGGSTATGGNAGTGSECVMEAPAGGGGAPPCPAKPVAVPGDVREGDVVIATRADAEAARTLSEITGDLTVLPSFCGALELPNLVTVGGSVRVEAELSAPQQLTWPDLTALRLPNLTSIGNELYLYLTDMLVETDFRSLESVGYRVYYMRNMALRRIGLDSLSQGSVMIMASPLAAPCEIEAICNQVGSTNCGATTPEVTCTCETRCERLEPVCM
jgi:hypothetical protein